jgi:multidrug efflux pump subunit AcrB
VKVMVDLPKMEAMEVSFSNIDNSIKSENITISGGNIVTDGMRRSIRIPGEFKNVDELKNIVIKRRMGDIVYLEDVADISFDYEDRESYARSPDGKVISLDVKKRSGENLLDAASKIDKILERAKENRFPEGLSISLTNDQSKRTKDQVTNLENSIISGVILVVLVLLFFLGLRNSLFVGVAIPLSMLTGFLILNFSGVTMNLVVLFSLILGLGMLVDNGIVVVENIYRLMQEGKSGIRAAKEGVGEVAWPIITSTATTLSAFVPLLFWNDIMGEFMKYLPITLIIVLASSLFVALVINPVLTSLYMDPTTGSSDFNKKKIFSYIAGMAVVAIAATVYNVLTPEEIAWAKILRNLMLIFIGLTLLNVYALRPAEGFFQNVILVKIEQGYYKTLRFALTSIRPYLFLGGTVLVLFLSIVLLYFRAPKINLFPINEPQYINIFVELPVGTDIEETNDKTEKIERRLFEILEPYGSGEDSIVSSIITNVGKGTSPPMENRGPRNQFTPNKAKITVSFVEFEERNGISTGDVMEKVRNNLTGFPGVNITVEKNRVGPPTGKPVNIEVAGENYEVLIDNAKEMKNYIANAEIPGIEKLQLDLETGQPELLVNVKRKIAKRYGVSTAKIGQAIRTALFGKEVSQYKLGEDEYPIMVRLQDQYRYDLNDLLEQKITFRDRASGGRIVQVPISAVADIEYSSSFGAINRKNKKRVITIYSNVKEGYNSTAINNKIQKLLKGFDLPAGYNYKFTGKQKEQQQSSDFLTKALLVSLLLILLIIVAQFNSILTPFIIIASVIFSTIGVFLGLAIFKMDFIVMMTGIGIISLAGIVVNNAIVLIDYTNLVRQREASRKGLDYDTMPNENLIESIIQGGKVRLRPVLLTAITTILGLIPLAVGFNINFYSLIKDWEPQIFIGGDNVIFWGPMAWTVIFGLAFATFLTLVIVPVMYLIAERVKRLFLGGSSE